MSKNPARVDASTIVPAIIPAAPQTAPKAAKAKPETFVDQTVVDAFLSAENGVKESAVALFLACTEHRVSAAQFHGRSDGKVRASEFNSAHTVGLLLGRVKAKQFITKAAEKSGDKRANVLAALRSVKKVAPELKSSALKGAALQAEIAKRADAASTKSSEAFKASRTPRVPALPKANTVGAYAPIAHAALLDLLNQAGKITAAGGQLRAWKEFTDTLSEAVDMAQALTSKDAK